MKLNKMQRNKDAGVNLVSRFSVEGNNFCFEDMGVSSIGKVRIPLILLFFYFF